MIRQYIRHNKDFTSDNFPHGKFAGYQAGCKCEACNRANNDKKRIAYQNRNKEKEMQSKEIKICGGCEREKPTTEFYPSGEYLSPYCKDCETIRRRKYSYLREYNLSIESFEQLVETHKNLCAICRKNFSGREPFVDHCHKTDKVRGLLCAKCNFGIGQFNDDVELLRKAISYLEKFGC